MAETIEITQYKYYTYSSRNVSNTIVLLYGHSGYIGAAMFDNGTNPLPPAVKHSSGVFSLYYRYVDLAIIIDMLRNEKPLFLIFNGGQNSRISTAEEPVGEGEM